MTTAIPSGNMITAARLRDLQRDEPDLCILDVRTGGEFETVHIPGSYNVPLDALGQHGRHVASVERPLVLVCQSGARATQAHRSLTTAGKQALHVLDGGITAWEVAGGDVARGGTERWAMDRQVRLAAGTIALTGIVLSTVVPGAKWLAGGVAAGLTFSALSNTCAMGTALSKLPYNQADPLDIDAVLAGLNGPASS